MIRSNKAVAGPRYRCISIVAWIDRLRPNTRQWRLPPT